MVGGAAGWGGGEPADEVRADTADLQRFVEAGAGHVSSLRAMFDQLAAARSRTSAGLGSAELPLPRVAKPSGGVDPLAELIAEASLSDAFVAGITEALAVNSAAGSLVVVRSQIVDAALARAGLDGLGSDRSQALDVATVEKLAIRRELEAIVAVGAGGPGNHQGQMIGLALEEYLVGLAGADPDRIALVAEVLVDAGLDLQVGLIDGDPDADHDRPGRAAAASMLVTQGILLWPGDRADLVEDLTGRTIGGPGGKRSALSVLVDALDLDQSGEDLNGHGLGFGEWHRANQAAVRQAALVLAVESTIAADGSISAGGQALADDVLDRYPSVVALAEDTWHEIVPEDRYQATVDGRGPRSWPTGSVRQVLAEALAAPNDGLDDGEYALARSLDDVDVDLVAAGTGSSSPPWDADVELRWLERQILVERLTGGRPEEEALLTEGMAGGLSAAEALRLTRFAARPAATDDRVRRLRVVYDTNPWGDPVPVDGPDPARWDEAGLDRATARSLAVELAALQGVQLGRFAAGRPAPERPLTDRQVDLVARYAEVEAWFQDRFAWAWPGGAEAAAGHLAGLGDDELRRILPNAPAGFADLLDELADPTNQPVWDLLAGAAGNDTFLGPDGSFRPPDAGRSGLGDAKALLVQLEILGAVGPYQGLLDGDGDGVVSESEAGRWLAAAREDPRIPPALVDRVAFGTANGLGQDTFGWDEVAAIVGTAGLAAAVVASVVYSAGTATPLWVQGGLVGLASFEAYASHRAGNDLGAALAGAGAVADLAAAAQLVRLARAGQVDELIDPARRAVDEYPDLVELAGRSDIPALRALADDAADLTPNELVGRFEVAVAQGRTQLVQELIEDGATPAQVAVTLREAHLDLPLAPGRIEHALDGNINGAGKASGGHHPRSPNIRVVERSAPDASGVTTGAIVVRDASTGGWVTKDAKAHTFFPQHWTRRQTELEIDYAYKRSKVDVKDAQRWIGAASDGTPIAGFYAYPSDPERGWSSAYPLFQRWRTG